MITLRSLAIELGTTVNDMLEATAGELFADDEQISEEEADMVREVYRAWGEQHVLVDWTNDAPTLDSDHAHTYDQHGRVDAPWSTDHGRRMVRLLWSDGSPIDDSRGIWKRCDECGSDGRLIQVEDEE